MKGAPVTWFGCMKALMTRKSKLSARVYALARVRIERQTSRYACFAIEDSNFFGNYESEFFPWTDGDVSDRNRQSSIRHIEAFAAWFKPDDKYEENPWWDDFDYESRALALAFMEYFVREGIVK